MDTYTGTANVDVVSGAVANIQAADTVNGGAGTADVLNITDSGILDMTVAGAGAGVTAFEVMNLQGASGNAITLGLLAGAFTTINGSSGVDNITVGSITNATTLAAGAGADKLTVTAALAAASDLDKVSGVETIVLSAATSAAGLTTKDALVATGSTLNLTFTGANTFDGSAETDGNFVITGGAGDSTYTLGKGNDQLTVGAGIDTIKVMTSASGLDKITNFDASGTDIIQFSAAGFTATGGAVSFAAGGATLDTVTAAGAAGTPLTAANHVIVWNVAPTTAANLNTALATQNGATAKEAFIIYTNTNGFTTIAYDSNIADATNTVVDLIQLAGVAATSVTATELAFIA